jgi:hypothetical protein
MVFGRSRHGVCARSVTAPWIVLSIGAVDGKPVYWRFGKLDDFSSVIMFVPDKQLIKQQTYKNIFDALTSPFIAYFEPYIGH